MAARYPGCPGTQSKVSRGDRSAEGKVDHEIMILQNDKAEKLQQMLNEQKITTTTRDESGRFLLHKACEYCCPQCILLLLANGEHTTVKVYDVAGYAPIHIAVRKNVEENVRSLIQHDETLVHYPTAYGETPIMIGGLHGCLEVVKYLQSCGASLKHRADSNNTLVHYAASSRCPRTLEYVLQQNGMKDFVNTPNKQGDTAAHNAMRSGCSECIRVLLNYGADFDIRNKLSQTPIDIAESLGNQRCLNAMHTAAGAASTEGGHQVTPVSDWYIPRDPKDKQKSYSFPSGPPSSLSNDSKIEFHKEGPTIETAIPLQGGDMSQSGSEVSDTDGVASAVPNGNGIQTLQTAEHSSARSGSLGSRLPPSKSDKHVALPPTKAMKKKTGHSSERDSPADGHLVAGKPKKEAYKRPLTDPRMTKRTATPANGGEENVSADNGASPPANQQKLSQPVTNVTTEEVHKCTICGRQLIKRVITCEGAGDINTGFTTIGSAGKIEIPEWICLDRDRHPRPGLSPPGRRISSHQKSRSPAENGHEESGYFSLNRDLSLLDNIPSSGQPYTDHPEPTITVELQPQNVEGKYGEEVTLKFEVRTNSSHYQLKYYWYKIRGGRSPQLIKDASTAELRWKISEKQSLLFYCRACLENKDNIFVESRKAALTAKLVWITEPLRLEGGYYGETAFLKCKAKKAPVKSGSIKYLWLKRLSKQATPQPYKVPVTEESVLTFDPFTPEHNGYYSCQADIGIQFDETEEVLVQGKNRTTDQAVGASTGSIQITKQPRSCVVVEGGELQLRCRAELRAGVKGSLHYQWFHHDTAITGATDPTYRRANTQASSTGGYYCKVTGEGGKRVSTQQVTVALSHPEEAGEEGGFKSTQQCNQIEARRLLRTSTGKRFAREKVALLIGNQAYEPGSHLCNLTTPENDVGNLTNVLTESGFKVFSLVNLRCHEMMKALKFVCDLLVPGVYVVFVYIGHGCRLHNSDYFIPVDARHPLNPAECIASATISERLQSHLGRIFKITNCCRSSAPSEATYRCTENQHNHDFANIVEVTSCSEGQQSYEVKGQTCSSFSTALTMALRGEGTYMQVLENVQKKMRECFESVNGSTFAEPRILLSSMDKEISFHDDVMLDDTQYEDKLDQLENTWKEIHTVPGPVRLTLGPELSHLLLAVELEFDWEFSNVLLVQVKWRVCRNTCSACSVTMSPGGQEVSIERADVPPTGASFRVNSLQRLSASLQLHLTFSATVTDGTTIQHTVTHDLQSRPLYAQVSSS